MRNLMDCINNLFSRASGYLLMLIMALCVADLTIRNFGFSLLGILEFSILIVVAAIFLGLGYCEEKDGHVRVTLLLDRLPVQACAALRVFNMAIALAAALLLCYACVRATVLAYQGDNAVMAGDVTLYTWPTRAVMSVSLAGYAIQLALNMVTEIKNFRSPHPMRSPIAGRGGEAAVSKPKTSFDEAILPLKTNF